MRDLGLAQWYSVLNTAELDSPTLLVYPDRVDENIKLALKMVGSAQRLRPHVKTHKCSKIVERHIALGIKKFKCATLAEAAMLGRCGAEDVLLAYPLIGPRMHFLFDLMEQFPGCAWSVLVDNENSARSLSQMAEERKQSIGIFLDLDIGMHRTGMPIDEYTEEFYQFCLHLPGLELKGLHAYDGHVREANTAKLWQICITHYRPLAALIDQLSEKGCRPQEIVVGGSPSFPFYASMQDVVCSPGTYALWDYGYARDCPNQAFLPAALLLCRVISLPQPDLICVDLGHKAVSAENPIEQRVYFLNAPTLQPIKQSEEHLVLKIQEPSSFQVGDILYGLPYHICPTVHLYDHFHVVKAGRVQDVWEIDARQRFRWKETETIA